MIRSVLILCLLLISGCATGVTVGSRSWHEARTMEIDAAYQNGEISKTESISLKNEADKIRVKYESEMDKTFNRDRHHHHYYYRRR